MNYILSYISTQTFFKMKLLHHWYPDPRSRDKKILDSHNITLHCTPATYYLPTRFEQNIKLMNILLKIAINKVRLAERSKAPDLSSGSRMRAWVRTPHLTIAFVFYCKQITFIYFVQIKFQIEMPMAIFMLIFEFTAKFGWMV